jgi:hypothetical protein
LDLPIELLSLVECKKLTQQLGQQLLDYAEPTEMQELVELARSGPPEAVKIRAREVVKGRIPPKALKEMRPDQVLQEFLEISVDMTIHYDAIAEIVRRDLGNREQMIFYHRRLKEAELGVRVLLSIIEASDRLTADDLAFHRPTLGRGSLEGVLQAMRAICSDDAALNPQAEPKPKLPPLKLTPAKKLPPLKLQKRPRQRSQVRPA